MKPNAYYQNNKVVHQAYGGVWLTDEDENENENENHEYD